MARELIVQTYKAGAAIQPYRLVKFGNKDYEVVPAAAVGDLIIGVTTRLGAAASGDPIEVVRLGPALVDCVSAVGRGKFVTSAADGKGAEASTGNRSIGVMETNVAAGALGQVLIIPTIA